MLKYLFFVVTFNTLGRLPLRPLYAFMTLVGTIAYYLVPKVRRNVHANLRHVMPPHSTDSDIRRAARRIFQNIALYYSDLAHMPHMDIKQFFNDRMIFHGVEEYLRPAIAEGKGVIMLGAHFGNPELAGQALIPLGISVFALTEPLDPRISSLLDRMRSSKGHTFAPVGVGNVKRVIQTLKRGGVVALMGDRDIQGPKQLLPFCGVETLMPTGPIELALRTGAAVIPSFSMRRQNYVIEAVAEEPLDVARTGDLQHDVRVSMLRFLDRYERRLRAEPEQWGVLEAIWDTTTAVQETPPTAAGPIGEGE